jgi:RNA polymerase sigma factor (sigma-70 family)
MINDQLVQQFYDAVITHNEALIARTTNELRSNLIMFLRASMKASINDAEDAIQNVFMYTINNIRSGNIEDAQRIGAYMVKAAKNQFLSMLRKGELESLDENPAYVASLNEQIEVLVEEEKLEALRDCVDELDDNNRSFMRFWLLKPDEKAEVIANYFKMSVNNVFTKKHRLIKILRDCVSLRLNS